MTLFLLPNLLHPDAVQERYFPETLREIVASLDGLIAESPKEGRAYLKRLGRAPQDVPQKTLNEHTTLEELAELLKPLVQGKKWGYVADAGLPCLADPGAELVARAREKGILIEAIMGPSSIMLAVMLSGLPSQKFSFHGYLPQDPAALRKMLKMLEKRAREEEATQVFIETPYRNDKLMKTLVEELEAATKLCIACHLTAPDQLLATKTIAAWRKGKLPELKDKPTVFLVR